MSSNPLPYHKLTGHVPQPLMPLFGIEVEAERFVQDEYEAMISGEGFERTPILNMLGYWRATSDGSLRHNGVEWVSQPLVEADAMRAIDVLYIAMRERMFAPSVRSGIHVHVNIGPLYGPQIVERMRAYAVLEPLLFRAVGVEREQNIYCVPLYRAVNEQRVWRDLARNLLLERPTRDDWARMQRGFRSCCKYSALNLAPFLRFGTMEFRHAPTFELVDEMRAWLRLVSHVSQFTLPANATLDSLADVQYWAELLVPNLSWDAYLSEVRDRGLLEFANSLQPYTYKVAEWGKPAGLAFDTSRGIPRPAYDLHTDRPPAINELDEMLEEERVVQANEARAQITLEEIIRLRDAMRRQEVR